MQLAILYLLLAAGDRAWAATGANCTLLPHVFECIYEQVFIYGGTTFVIVSIVVIVIFVIGVLQVRRQRRQSSNSSSANANAERGMYCSTTPDASAIILMRYIAKELAIYTKPIGGGAFGTVFKGSFRGESCAIKVLNPHATQLLSSLQTAETIQSESLRRFENECDTLKHFKHPNLVRYISSCNDPRSNLPLLVMELMDESLTRFLKHSHLPTCTQVSLSHNICSGLVYIHEKNLLHRDLCSDNVLLRTTPTMLAKISDFGMSRLIDPEDLDKSLTTLGHREAFLPPEARKITYSEYDSSLDIFSFGVVMVQMVVKAYKISCSADRDVHIEDIKNAEAMSPLYNLITSCVQVNKDNRPNALKISQNLENLSL